MPFQKNVNLTPAPAVAGDFASANPRTTVLAGEGSLVAGAGGVIVGNFAWQNNGVAQSHGVNGAAPDGFVHNDMQALIQTYLAEYGMNVPAGFPVVLFNNGDFWALNAGTVAATIGATVYARFSDGAIMFGGVPTGATATGAIGSTNTAAIGATFTASAGTPTTELVVTSVTGLISIGDTVSGTGIPAGTTILSQVSGTTGGAGTYNLSAANTASAATVTSFGNVLKTSSTTGVISIGDTVSGGSGFPVGATVLANPSTNIYTLSAPATAYVASATGVTTYGNVLVVSAVGSGTLAVGDSLTGSGVPAGAALASQVSGVTGAAGTYTLSVPATAYVASTALTVAGGVATTWLAKSTAAVGELVKISTWG